jgi:hypothetical protein
MLDDAKAGNDVTSRFIDHGFRAPVTCVFPLVSNGALSTSAARERLKPEVTSLFNSPTMHGFLLVFNPHYLSNMHHLKVTPNFLIVDNDGMSISTARGRLRPEVTSPFDSLTVDPTPIW